MHELPNGCRCSDIKVTKNKNGKNQIWRIYYRFYDPTFDNKPHLVVLKSGINQIQDLKIRSTTAKAMIENEWRNLTELGYNPITETINTPIEMDYEVDPKTPFIKALEKAMDKLSVGHRTKIGIKSVIKGISKAALQLRFNHVPISQISRRHIKMILEQCGRNSKKWSNGRYNLYRAYLLMLFKELVEMETINGNPIRDISKKQTIQNLKTVLTPEQRILISDHLSKVYPEFLDFIHLFFHSGGRKTELFQVKPPMVNLATQKYRCIIKKGKRYIEVERTIKDVAIPYWEKFLKDCPDDHYIFGAYYKPGLKSMVIDGPSRHWRKYVKEDLGIKVDFYSLKHLNTTEIVDALDEQAAAELNKHSGTGMVVKIYDVKQKDRQHEKLKKVNNKFV